MLRHSCDNGSPTTAGSAFAMPKPYSLDLRERVNIRPGRAIKHFTAYDPVAKYNHDRPLAISPQRVSKRHSPKTQPSHKC
jgi:hypothetical protein